MSPRRPVVTAKQLINAIKKKGFVFSRQTGSHAIYKNSDNRRAVIPIHGNNDLGVGLLQQILKDANITFEELIDLL